MNYQPMTVMQGKSNIRLVDVPNMLSRGRKGSTKYDEWFIKMIDNKEAIRMPEDEFGAVRKAAFRFLDFRGWKEKVTIRQLKHQQTRTYTMWFMEREDE